MTNADMIRAMSEEELAANLMCPNEMGMADIPCDKSDQCNCYKCLLDWLRQSAVEIYPAIQQAGKESNGGNSRTTDTQKP